MVVSSLLTRLKESKVADTPNVRRILGVLLILVGIAGLFLPFLQGVLFIGLGVLLFTRHDWKEVLEKYIKKFKKKF